MIKFNEIKLIMVIGIFTFSPMPEFLIYRDENLPHHDHWHRHYDFENNKNKHSFSFDSTSGNFRSIHFT